MNVERARLALTAPRTPRSGLENFVVRGPELSDAQVSRFELEQQLAGDVSRDVLHGIDAVASKQLLAYDPSYQTNTSQILVEELSLIPELDAVDTLVRIGDVALDTAAGPALAMAHVVGSGDATVVAYRLKGAGIATRRARGIPLIPRDGIYRVLRGDILYYEPRFDVYTCGGFAFFATVSLIQTKLHAEDKARRLAKETLAAVTVKVSIDGFDGLQAAVMNDPAMRAKMASVARLVDNDPEYAERLTTENLVEFVESYPDYRIQVCVVDGQKVLRFDGSPQHRHQIPRLLADDYLHSYLTDRNYEAGSKQRVRR